MIMEGREDITGTCKVAKIEILPQKGKGREIESQGNVRFETEF
jgi:hypothetical protein